VGKGDGAEMKIEVRSQKSEVRSKKLGVILALITIFTSPLLAQIGGTAGTFARMGFNARGMSMGNALTAMQYGEIQTHYNPALAPFAEAHTATVSFSLLSLDRYLNFLSYTQNAPPTAGFSVGIINAGVRHIDGRDNDGFHTEEFSTSENQFYLSFANRFDERVSLGVTVKLYYYKLFEEVSSTTVGFDAGIVVLATDDITVGFTVQDIASKYKWDTSPIYGQNGATTTEKFPTLFRGGITYKLPESYGVVSLDFENSSEKTFILRLGGEFFVHEFVSLRGGIDRWNLKDNTAGAKPSLGFGLTKPFGDWIPKLDYAYVFEPFAPSDMHIITLSVRF
jgi:hypothetical protein